MEARHLYESYLDKDLDGHTIFRLSCDTTRELIQRYQHPLAYMLAGAIVEYFTAIYWATEAGKGA